MLTPLLLLLAQTVPDGAPELSPALAALVETRKSLEPEEFARRAEALAESGDASAAELVAEAYRFGGFGFARSPGKACDWHESAAKTRSDATHNLALCYETGEGRVRDLARARELYAEAAEMGWAQAKCALGTMLVAGRGGPADPPRGVELCRQAAETGNANAQTDYGGFVLMGQGVKRDAVAAREWLTLAAKQNQPNAAFLVAQIHWHGDGTPVDRAEAERWWRVAHEHGRKDAAAWIARAVFRRVSPDGKTIADRSLIPEWVKWAKAAAAEDPDPATRKQFADAMAEF